MSIDRDQVLRIARLARLRLDEAEVGRLTGELGAIVEHVARLAEVDVRDVPPTQHVQLDRLPTRSDTVLPSLSQEQATAAAPEPRDGGFGVPPFVDEG